VRLALFMFVLTGALVALPAFADTLNPRFLLLLCCGGYGLLGYLRLVKQAPKVDCEHQKDSGHHRFYRRDRCGHRLYPRPGKAWTPCRSAK
jgi:hypothetical protein